AGGYLWSLANQPGGRGVAFEQLPYRQWSSVVSAAAGAAYVSKLEFKDGRWTVETAVEKRGEGAVKDREVVPPPPLLPPALKPGKDAP
ncbi:MAG: hypothetical protein WCJ64_22740, partial [Rhodospirillaceae bacterium]